ncbi:MAG: HAMP domain-containing histidine kinase [Myxococcales bacterium]|nr:HAMP domain-containing histidine kinase [Myxococcales bacterium]
MSARPPRRVSAAAIAAVLLWGACSVALAVDVALQLAGVLSLDARAVSLYLLCGAGSVLGGYCWLGAWRRAAPKAEHSAGAEVMEALELLAQEQAAEVAKQNEELKARALVLQQQNRDLERANRLKREFLANMSHELRTPLSSVIGFSELMLAEMDAPLAPEHREFARDIYRAGKHLLEMINNILDLAKIEAGRMEFAREPVDLGGALREAEEIVRSLALKKELSMEVNVADVTICLGDRQRVVQVALNLLSNAAKFTPRGGRVTASVRTCEDGAHAELVVQDTGIGIDPGDQELIFEQFRQVDGGIAREYGGTGLGLALVRKFLDAMGGTVSVASRLGEGATFTVRLPRLAEAGAAAEQSAAAGSDTPERSA